MLRSRDRHKQPIAALTRLGLLLLPLLLLCLRRRRRLGRRCAPAATAQRRTRGARRRRRMLQLLRPQGMRVVLLVRTPAAAPPAGGRRLLGLCIPGRRLLGLRRRGGRGRRPRLRLPGADAGGRLQIRRRVWPGGRLCRLRCRRLLLHGGRLWRRLLRCALAVDAVRFGNGALPAAADAADYGLRVLHGLLRLGGLQQRVQPLAHLCNTLTTSGGIDELLTLLPHMWLKTPGIDWQPCVRADCSVKSSVAHQRLCAPSWHTWRPPPPRLPARLPGLGPLQACIQR